MSWIWLDIFILWLNYGIFVKVMEIHGLVCEAWIDYIFVCI
jgi:hypothetical protein